MFKVLIVDDEPIVRLGFKSLVNWEENGIEVKYEASNGKQALDIIKNSEIDLVITDINMPVMDGLELIQNLNKLSKTPEIVVLSAYEDYELVRRSFKLGVRDYIVKFKMVPEDVLTMLKNIFSSMDKREEKTTFYQFKRARRNFLRNLIMGTSSVDPDITAKELKINTENKTFILCSFIIDNYSSLESKYMEGDLQSVLKSIKNTIDQATPDEFEVIALSPEEYALFTLWDEYREESIITLLDSVRKNLNNFLNIDVSIGLSPEGDDISALQALYKVAHKSVNLRFILGKGKNIFPEECKTIYHTSHIPIRPISRELFSFFDKLDYEKTFEKLDEILKLIELFKAETLKELLYEYSKLLILFNSHLIDNDIDPENYLVGNAYAKLSKFETTSEVHTWIKEYFETVFKDIKHKRILISPVIREAKIYIDDNYMDKNLLKSMCKYLKINKSYFSTLFAQEMHLSFSTYLTTVRINHAKELLETTGKRVYELCDEVGYSNTEHFSRVFKKETGFSPSQYRNIYYKE